MWLLNSLLKLYSQATCGIKPCHTEKGFPPTPCRIPIPVGKQPDFLYTYRFPTHMRACQREREISFVCSLYLSAYKCLAKATRLVWGARNALQVYSRGAGGQRPKYSSHHLLPPRVYISRKLPPGVGGRSRVPRHPDTGGGCFKCWDNACPQHHCSLLQLP